MKVNVNWAHASAQQLKRALVDSAGGKTHLQNYMDEMSGHCEVCCAFDDAPHVPIAGTSTKSMLNWKVQAGPFLLGELAVLRAMDVYLESFSIAPTRSKSPQKV